MRRSIGRTVRHGGLAALIALASVVAGACSDNNTPTTPTTPITPSVPTTTETFTRLADGQRRGHSRVRLDCRWHGNRADYRGRSVCVAGVRAQPRHLERLIVPGGHRQRRRAS